MSETEERDETRRGRRLWGAPGWAWGAGLAIGCVLGLMMFDGLIGLVFGVSIGTAFAIAFGASGSAGR